MVVTGFRTVLGRASPQCVLGQMMKLLFKQEDLMSKVSDDTENRYVSHGWELCSIHVKIL